MDHPVELKHTVMVEHPVAIEEEEECDEGEERRGLRDFQAVASHEPALLRMRNLSDTTNQGQEGVEQWNVETRAVNELSRRFHYYGICPYWGLLLVERAALRIYANQPVPYDPIRGLRHDCEIFANLRLHV